MALNNTNPQQIIRKDGNNCFVEVVSSSFPIGRVLFRFINYDNNLPQGSKCTANIEIYLTFATFFRLSNAFQTGRLDAAIQMQKQKGIEKGYSSGFPLVLDMGGKSAKKLAAAGKARPDNMSISRQLKIMSGDKFPYLLQAETGPGEEDSHGLIVPKYSKPEQKVMVPLTYDSLLEIFLLVTEHIRGYLASSYTMEAMNPTAPQTPSTQAANTNANQPQNNYKPRNNYSQAQSAPNNNYNNSAPRQQNYTPYNSAPVAPSNTGYNQNAVYSNNQPAPAAPVAPPPTQSQPAYNPPPQPTYQQPPMQNPVPQQTYAQPQPAPAPNSQEDADFFNSLAGDFSFT